MKLRNKKTGEIGEVGYLANSSGEIIVNHIDDLDEWYTYKSLAELNEEWEDYEEPKEYYWVDYDGKVKTFLDLYEWQDKMKEIGNYFETKEEAEKAVEKLKAWKRLKDTYHIGFALDFIKNNISFTYRIDDTSHSVLDEEHIVYEDIKTILGGEE